MMRMRIMGSTGAKFRIVLFAHAQKSVNMETGSHLEFISSSWPSVAVRRVAVSVDLEAK